MGNWLKIRQVYISYLKTFFFFVSVGGYLSHSSAIMTDAAHLLSDFGSFMIGLFALLVGALRLYQFHNF